MHESDLLKYHMDQPFMHLEVGRDYVVARSFLDYDRCDHPFGERWRYLGHNFVPYEDGLSLYAEIEGVFRQVRMQWRDEEQSAIIDELGKYLEAA